MSVVVRMEMPKSCPCDFVGYGYSVLCSAVNGIPKRVAEYDECVKNGTKPDWCPIICQLPEWHGRLVDADELFYDLFVMADGRVVPNMDCDGRHHLSMHVKDIKRRIIETPTIVPAEIERSEKMSDLIDRQAAIDAIRASTSKYTGFMGMEMYTDDDAVEAIEAVPAASPWHRVEEELPALKEVLPRYFVSGMCVLYNADTESFDTGFATKLDFGDAEMDWKALYVNNPTHWMPIEPPKEDA